LDMGYGPGGKPKVNVRRQSVARIRAGYGFAGTTSNW
jgi:hypothetical protein